MDPYALIAQMPNAGQAFSDAFQKGQQQNALASFAQNPNPQTAGAAARYDPSAVLQYNLQAQKQKQELSAEHEKAWHSYAGNLAQWADSPDKWDHAVDQMVTHGFPEAAQLKGKFSPEVRANFMALGGVHDAPGANDPKYFNLTPGSSVVAIDPATRQSSVVVQPNDGSQTSGGQAPSPGGGDLRSEAIRAIQAGADPVKVMQRLQQMQGGQAATPPATFPGPH